MSTSYLKRPSLAELEAARAAEKQRKHLCGCFVQLLRDPLFPPLTSHWRTYHADSLAILAESQYHARRRKAANQA